MASQPEDDVSPPLVRAFSVVLEETPSDSPSTEKIEPVPVASAPKAAEDAPAAAAAPAPAGQALSPPAAEASETPRDSLSPRELGGASLQRRGGAKAQPKSEWIEGQKHTFTAWINFQLRGAVPPCLVKDLVKDLQNGVVLCQLTNKLIAKNMKPVRFKQSPTMKVQKVENLSQAIKTLTADGLKIVNIGAEDIHDANETIVLGLLWSIILKYQVGGAFEAQDEAESSTDSDEEDEFAFSLSGSDGGASSSSSAASSSAASSSSSEESSSVESSSSTSETSVETTSSTSEASSTSESSSSTTTSSASSETAPSVPTLGRASSSSGITKRARPSAADAKNRLLEWVRDRCEPFGVKVNDFTKDFADGLAFSALSASIDPRYDFFSDSKAGTAKETMERSFDFNEKELDIPQLLKADYLAAPLIPDEKSVMTYVSLLYQYHGNKKPVVPEEEVELHIDVTGDGLKNSVAGKENTFGINVLNNKTKALLPATDQLSCTMVTADGRSVEVKKVTNADGGTEFLFTPTSTEPIDVLLKYGNDEIASMRINPAPPLTIDWNTAGDVPVGSPCHLPGVLRDRNGNPVALADAANVKVRVVKIKPSHGKDDDDDDDDDEEDDDYDEDDDDDDDSVVKDAKLVAKDDGTFEVVFTPDTAGEYSVQLSAYGVDLAPLKVVATPSCTAQWDLLSNTDVPVNFPCTVSGSLVDHNGNKLPIDADTKLSAIGPDGNAVECSLVANDQGGFDVQFTPTMVGDYQLIVDYHGTPLPTKTVTAVKAQIVPVNKPARIVVNDVPVGLATQTTKVLVVGPSGKPVKATIDLSSNYAPVCVDFTPTEVGPHRLILDGGETTMVLPPVVARDDIEVVQVEATLSQACELRIPWTTSYDDGEDTTVVLLPPPDSSLSKSDIKILERGGEGDNKWVVAQFTPDVEGEFHVAAEHRGQGVECLVTVNAHSLKKSHSGRSSKSKRKRPKAVEVVSIEPIAKPDWALVRIYFGDDELAKMLGLQRNFKTHPLTADSTYQEIRDALLRKFSTALDEKMRKKLQAIVKRDQTCIVFVNPSGEKMAPLTDPVLPDINRFKKETAERILAESRASTSTADLAASPSSSGLSPRSLSPRDTTSPRSAASSSSASSSSSSSMSKRTRRAQRKADPHGTRKEIAHAREAEKREALRLAQNVGSGAGWNIKSGTFKLVGTIHTGEHLKSLRRGHVGKVFCELKYNDRLIKTSQLDLQDGDPQWDTQFSFNVEPGKMNDLVIHLRHTGGDDLLGVVIIPLGFLQPDMSKKAWYVLKKPSALTSLSRRRLLVTLEHHVLEVEPDTRLFLKPAPRLYLEILVNYPKTRMKVGEELVVTSEVRDETKNFCLTDDLKGGQLQLFVLPPNTQQPLILDFENNDVGIFTFTFKPTEPGSYKSMLRYSGAAMQHKLAKIEVASTRRVYLR